MDRATRYCPHEERRRVQQIEHSAANPPIVLCLPCQLHLRRLVASFNPFAAGEWGRVREQLAQAGLTRLRDRLGFYLDMLVARIKHPELQPELREYLAKEAPKQWV